MPEKAGAESPQSVKRKLYEDVVDQLSKAVKRMITFGTPPTSIEVVGTPTCDPHAAVVVVVALVKLASRVKYGSVRRGSPDMSGIRVQEGTAFTMECTAFIRENRRVRSS
ncbi:hypothetical protein LTR95_009183 [Oleoguttula sp. CCFEE 5521]